MQTSTAKTNITASTGVRVRIVTDNIIVKQVSNFACLGNENDDVLNKLNKFNKIRGTTRTLWNWQVKKCAFNSKLAQNCSHVRVLDLNKTHASVSKLMKWDFSCICQSTPFVVAKKRDNIPWERDYKLEQTKQYGTNWLEYLRRMHSHVGWSPPPQQLLEYKPKGQSQCEGPEECCNIQLYRLTTGVRNKPLVVQILKLPMTMMSIIISCGLLHAWKDWGYCRSGVIILPSSNRSRVMPLAVDAWRLPNPETSRKMIQNTNPVQSE